MRCFNLAKLSGELRIKPHLYWLRHAHTHAKKRLNHIVTFYWQSLSLSVTLRPQQYTALQPTNHLSLSSNVREISHTMISKNVIFIFTIINASASTIPTYNQGVGGSLCVLKRGIDPPPPWGREFWPKWGLLKKITFFAFFSRFTRPVFEEKICLHFF